ncbi:hypothetical protein bcgnr5378_37760 [Bacillus cereus]|uniref:Uncharacterized protein n=1 Tax=Bacillus cereus TaxID=1396 RepID=A0A161SV83_BACCE|nr:hypothetical protein [Bacillus cereus]KZD71895.1 hypothetical protein B4088_0356 [Bacillus cereus]
MDNSIDEKLISLKNNLDPMLLAVNSNYKKVKTKNGFERMWLPLLMFYPMKQLVSLVTFGKYGMKVSKVQGITASIIAAAPFLSGFITSLEKIVADLSYFQIGISAFVVWYLFTVLYTFLQMPNWKNEELFHIDAYRLFRPNEYKLIEPFLGTNFSIESINNYLIRNSSERAILEIKEQGREEVSQLIDQLEDLDSALTDCEQRLIFTNEIIFNLIENLALITDDNITCEHLYLIRSPFVIYSVTNGQFLLEHKEYPRHTFPTSFNITEGLHTQEPFVECYQSNKLVHKGSNSYSFKTTLDENICWIITYFPTEEDAFALHGIFENEIVDEGNTLNSITFINMLNSHFKILHKKNYVNKKL